MKITQVEPQKKTLRLRSGQVPNRFNIYLDGKFAFGADADLVVDRRLIVGKQLDTSEVEEVLFEAEVGKLMERMYELFGRRQRSEGEVREYLRNLSFKRKLKDKEGIGEVVMDSLVEKLKKKGLINDTEFAKSWIEARMKKKGSKAIQTELYQKGIAKEIINDELQNINKKSQESVAEKLLEKKLERWKNLTDLEKKKKSYDFLLRRGFEYELVKEIVDNHMRKGVE